MKEIKKVKTLVKTWQVLDLVLVYPPHRALAAVGAAVAGPLEPPHNRDAKCCRNASSKRAKQEKDIFVPLAVKKALTHMHWGEFCFPSPPNPENLQLI